MCDIKVLVQSILSVLGFLGLIFGIGFLIELDFAYQVNRDRRIRLKRYCIRGFTIFIICALLIWLTLL